MKNRLINIYGWYGVVAILMAYAFLNLGVFSVKSIVYQVLNLTGSLGIVADALNDRDWQPAVLNIIWALVAIYALLTVFLAK